MNAINDECCVCFEQEMALSSKDGYINNYRLLCCGTLVCQFCKDKLDKEAEETGKDWDCLVCRSPRPKTAKGHFNMALTRVKEGRVWAFEEVGEMYKQGFGVTQSFGKAFEYYSLGAARGDPVCQFQFASMYFKGEGIKQSYEQAVKFCTLAAKQGLPKAQFHLAVCYFHGLGVEKSDEKAYEWYFRAAQNGVTEAQYKLALFYFMGIGTEQDYEKTVHYYTLAAEKDHKLSLYGLGTCYGDGLGVKQSFPKAIYWFKQCLKDNQDEKQCAEVKGSISETLEIIKSFCASCGNEETKLSLYCGRCLSAYYCNKTCQAKHWKAGGHKQECKEP